MVQPLLQVQNLSIDFTGGNTVASAVSNVSFSINKGEILAIVGESGSGKSVTALSLLQLLPPQAVITGKLLLQQKQGVIDLLVNPSASNIRGKDVAMIFQEPMTSLNPVLTCGQQVIEVICLHQQVSQKVAKEKTIQLFEKVKLPDPGNIIHRYPHQLSGGQKQRIMIAMAISCNPSLLIADEPTTALDVTVQKNILVLLKQLQQETGMGVIFITHDLGLVADVATNVAVMYKGEIIEQGITKEVLQNPQHPYTKALLLCRPANHQRGERLPVINDFFNGAEKVNFKNDGLAITNTISDSAPIKLIQNKEEVPEQPVLQVKQLTISYPGKKVFLRQRPQPFVAVNGVSFNVAKGETVGLVGESGCGKSTLGRAILQLVPVTSGNIILNGKEIAGLQKDELATLRKGLQIVFQDPYGSLNPRLMIGDAIMEPLKVHGLLPSNKARKEKTIALLEKVNLNASHYNRYPHQFSGGQRQRICIARALALNPSFLIFDESVSALDVSVQAQVLNLLNDLKKEFGFTSIFISHDLSVVRYFSDRILVMNKGKIVEEGLSDDVYFSPQNEYTKKLIASVPGQTAFI